MPQFDYASDLRPLTTEEVQDILDRNYWEEELPDDSGSVPAVNELLRNARGWDDSEADRLFEKLLGMEPGLDRNAVIERFRRAVHAERKYREIIEYDINAIITHFTEAKRRMMAVVNRRRRLENRTQKQEEQAQALC